MIACQIGTRSLTRTRNMLTTKLTLLQAGYTTAPEAIILRRGRWRKIRIPALFALIEHPHRSPILIDTGYSPRFLAATQPWPYRLYRWITPVVVHDADTAAAQLARRGIAATAVRRLIVTHFHVDHIGGLADFPDAKFIHLPDGYAATQGVSGPAALKIGFLPGHLPLDFAERSRPIRPGQAIDLPPEYAPFSEGWDILGDGSLLGVSLPGHAHGQMGVFLHDARLGAVLLAADACWHSRAYRELRPPHPLIDRWLPDAAAYHATLQKLHRLHQNRPDLHIIPAHCPEMAARYTVSS